MTKKATKAPPKKEKAEEVEKVEVKRIPRERPPEGEPIPLQDRGHDDFFSKPYKG